MDRAQILKAMSGAVGELLATPDWEQPVLAENAWFTPFLVREALEAVLPWLEPAAWASFPEGQVEPRRVGISMAGNIPLVGFHDFMTVLLMGHRPVVRFSSRDRELWRRLLALLPEEVNQLVEVREELTPEAIDFLLATGSDNTALHLEHRFGALPRLLRKNRFSAAVVKGGLEKKQLEGLARDILLYHGMGCRSVCNLLVPPGADLQPLVEVLEAFPNAAFARDWGQVVAWEAAVDQMKGEAFFPNSRIVFRKRESLAPAPLGVVWVVEVADEAELQSQLRKAKDQVQCVVGEGMPLSLGAAQCPGVNDFADGVDVWNLLLRQWPQAST